MKPSVLIIDAENMMCDGLVRRLTNNYSIYQARSGIEAVYVLKENKHIDVILCDVLMSEVIREIRSENKEVKMIVTTAFSSPRKVCEAMKQGAHNFMMKPLDFPLLEVTIKNAVRKRVVA